MTTNKPASSDLAQCVDAVVRKCNDFEMENVRLKVKVNRLLARVRKYKRRVRVLEGALLHVPVKANQGT